MYRRYTRLIKTNISVFRIRNDLVLDRIISSYIYWLRKKFCQLDFHLTLRAKWQLQVFNFHLATKFSEVAAFLMWLDIQPFHATTDLFLHPLQTPRNQRLDIQPYYYDLFLNSLQTPGNQRVDIQPFHATTDLFLHPLENTRKSQIFVFRGYRKETSAMKWVMAHVFGVTYARYWMPYFCGVFRNNSMPWSATDDILINNINSWPKFKSTFKSTIHDVWQDYVRVLH